MQPKGTKCSGISTPTQTTPLTNDLKIKKTMESMERRMDGEKGETVGQNELSNF